jgi:hypothetical protein
MMTGKMEKLKTRIATLSMHSLHQEMSF